MPIAPPAKIVRYLAIFHRFFAAWDEAATAENGERLWLCRWVADTLHNVPGMLTYRGEDRASWQERIEGWVIRFPSYLGDLPGTPARLVDECQEILSFSKTWEQLAVNEDLSDLDLAPPADFGWSMRVFGWAFLEMRQRPTWEGMDSKMWEWAVTCGKQAQPLARVLLPLCAGLVHWEDFDLDGFRQKLHTVWPEAYGGWKFINDPHPHAH